MRKDAQKQYEAKQAVFAKKHEVVANRRRYHNRDNRLSLIVGGSALAVAFVAQLAYFGVGPGFEPEASLSPTATPTPTATAEAPSPDVAEDREWVGSLMLNDAKLAFTLDGVNAPQATANFVSLAEEGFYEGLNCHRLTTSGIFVLQCGSPSGDGSGGPDYRFGPIENAPADDVYPAGTIAMARQSNLGDSMGSQFFIVYEDSTIPSDVAGGYTIFGTLTEGLDAILAIADAGTEAGNESPITDVVITALSVE